MVVVDCEGEGREGTGVIRGGEIERVKHANAYTKCNVDVVA